MEQESSCASIIDVASLCCTSNVRMFEVCLLSVSGLAVGVRR